MRHIHPGGDRSQCPYLGKPAANAPKYFATVQIAELASDCEWLSSATKQLAKHWRRKNEGKSLYARSGEQFGAVQPAVP
jgi:hypothetical protein